jgi:hypothetical protein
MTKEELLELLKENLSISINTETYQSFGPEGVRISVGLFFDGELISESYDTFSIES